MSDDYVPQTGNIRVAYTYVPGTGATPTEREAAFDRWLAEYRNSVIEDIADDIERHTVSSDEWWKNDFQNEYELAAHIRELKG